MVLNSGLLLCLHRGGNSCECGVSKGMSREWSRFNSNHSVSPIGQVYVYVSPTITCRPHLLALLPGFEKILLENTSFISELSNRQDQYLKPVILDIEPKKVKGWYSVRPHLSKNSSMLQGTGII